MLQKIAGKIWRIMPASARQSVIRFSQAKFTVSVGVVVCNKKKQILLLDHVLRPASGWGIPGGFIDYREQPEIAAQREILEETGLYVENLRFMRMRTIGRHIEIVYFGNADGIAEAKSREIVEVRWFEPDEFPSEMSESQKSLISKVLEVVNRESL
jgi:8-oxo-dGTP diphosphatase